LLYRGTSKYVYVNNDVSGVIYMNLGQKIYIGILIYILLHIIIGFIDIGVVLIWAIVDLSILWGSVMIVVLIFFYKTIGDDTVYYY